MVIDVRAAREEDAAAVAAILNAIIATGAYSAFDTPVTVDEERAFIKAVAVRGIFHVAVDGESGEVVGFQNVSPFADYTHAFDHVGVIGTYVAHGRQRQGIGGRLFDTMFGAACQRGYEKLFAYVRADNAGGLAAYGKQGFRVIGTAKRHARIDGRYIDEIFLEKLL